MMSETCPNCDNDPLESSHNLSLQMQTHEHDPDVELPAYLCGECGVVWVTNPHDTVRTEKAKTEGSMIEETEQ